MGFIFVVHDVLQVNVLQLLEALEEVLVVDVRLPGDLLGDGVLLRVLVDEVGGDADGQSPG